MLNVAMSHFQAHIGSKNDRCSLSIVDLLHVRNFKGRNASITEPVLALPGKLQHYESVLKEIEKSFYGKTLAELSEEQIEELKNLCNSFLELTRDAKGEIRGFGPSYASALLAAHFIDLLPVLDRRVLNGAGITVQTDTQGQVKDSARHYGELIDAFRQELRRSPGRTLRQLDKAWFSKPVPSRSSATP